jgi:hypothetical protein
MERAHVPSALLFNLQPGRKQYGEVTNVRFTPESGLNSDISPRPLWARIGHERTRKMGRRLIKRGAVIVWNS